SAGGGVGVGPETAADGREIAGDGPGAGAGAAGAGATGAVAEGGNVVSPGVVTLGAGRTSPVDRSPRPRGWITSATVNSAMPRTTSKAKLTSTAPRVRGPAAVLRVAEPGRAPETTTW